jgi:3-ketosteroid 9alpha-monooxygenase subunit A
MGTMMTPDGREPTLGGWHLLALADEVKAQVTGLALGSRALLAVRDERAGKVRVFDGTCPHRGAHLGHGGRATGQDAIVCPFHGKRIGLGEGTGRLCVREHEVIDGGGAIFVRLADVPARDHGFARVVTDILTTHVLTGAVIGPVRVPPELIIENAFDWAHFPTVHLIRRVSRPKVWLGPEGELNITAAFHTEAPDWESAEGDFASAFHARAFSPNLVVSELGSGASSKFVFTGAVPASGGCVARIAVALRRGTSAETVAALIDGSQIAFEEDLLIWDHLNLGAAPRLDTSDAPVLAFRAFCASFAAGTGVRAARPPEEPVAAGHGGR